VIFFAKACTCSCIFACCGHGESLALREELEVEAKIGIRKMYVRLEENGAVVYSYR
jgi:hypothetical protein